MSMSEEDLWPADQSDPLDDAAPEEASAAPEAPGDETQPETSPEQEPVAAETTEAVEEAAPEAETEDGGEQPEATPDAPVPDPADEWKRRYEGLRNSREATKAQLEQERQARAKLEADIRQYLTLEQQQAQRPAPQAPAPPPEPTDAELAQYGIDRDQYRYLQQQLTAQAQAQIAPQVDQLTQQQQALAAQVQAERARLQQEQQQAQTQAERQATAQAVLAFGEKFPEFTGDTLEAQGLRDDFDGLIQRWNDRWSRIDGAEFDPADLPSLEVAAEALKDPALADVLAESPHLFESDRGLALARAQARILAASDAPQAPKASIDSQAVDAKLKAAQTEPARSSGTAKSAGAQDEFDEALQEWQSDQTRSIF